MGALEESAKRILVFDKETEECVAEIPLLDMECNCVFDERVSCPESDVCKTEEEFEMLKEIIAIETEGSTVQPIEDDLCLIYLNEFNHPLAGTVLMPDIVNVSNPNDKTVFVEFADGTKEVAILNEDDTFNLETGVLICITKKLFSDMDILTSGSSAYNKVVKYALSKLDYTKKQKQKEIEARRAEKKKISSIKQAEREAENKKREDRIREMAEAYKRAIKAISDEAAEGLRKDLDELIDMLEKNEE